MVDRGGDYCEMLGSPTEDDYRLRLLLFQEPKHSAVLYKTHYIVGTYYTGDSCSRLRWDAKEQVLSPPREVGHIPRARESSGYFLRCLQTSQLNESVPSFLEGIGQ